MKSAGTLAKAPSRSFPRRSMCFAVIAAAALCVARAGAQDKKKDEPLPPESVTMTTSDGVKLAATYYPSKLGKEAVPVILVHGNKGSRGDFDELALKLQKAGHAAIAVDLRGHGESALGGGELRGADFADMVGRDLEAVKRFLLEKNNAGELNVERLGIVGADMGASIAINWAALDWSWPVLATGKQGQDVKAVVAVSPEWVQKGLRINDAIANPNLRSDVAFLIVAGARSAKLAGEARRLHNALARYRPAPPAGEADEKQTLWLKTPRTSLQGAALVNEKSLNVDEMILTFVDLRLVKPSFPWRARKNPLQQ